MNGRDAMLENSIIASEIKTLKETKYMRIRPCPANPSLCQVSSFERGGAAFACYTDAQDWAPSGANKSRPFNGFREDC